MLCGIRSDPYLYFIIRRQLNKYGEITMLYVISDKRDNSFFCGLNGWSNLEENAIWYGDDSIHNIDEMHRTLVSLKSHLGDHFYSVPLPAYLIMFSNGRFEFEDDPSGGVGDPASATPYPSIEAAQQRIDLMEYPEASIITFTQPAPHIEA